MHVLLRTLGRYGFILLQLVSIQAVVLGQNSAPSQSPFQLRGTFSDVGLVLNQMVGPGPAAGSQRLYVSVAYTPGGFDLLSIDPATGSTEVFHSPLPTETSAWGMAAGPDGNIYLGTGPNAHFVELDVRSGTMIDLGKPSKTESYIWQIAPGTDNKLYGGTFPDCRLVRFDPETGDLQDLGRLDPGQSYARYLAATADGFIYAGIGSSGMNIAAYDIATGQSKELLPTATQAGFADVYLAIDGNVYGTTAGTSAYALRRGAITPIPWSSLPGRFYYDKLADGRTAGVSNDGTQLVMTVSSSGGGQPVSYVIPYTGKPNSLFRIGLGSDGNIYGSGEMPSDLVRFDPAGGGLQNLGALGGGEVYSILASGSQVFMGAYSDSAILYAYDPAMPFRGSGKATNPQVIPIAGGDPSWRPEGATAGSDGSIYFGVIAGYGQLTGPLLVLNPESGAVTEFAAVPEQSVVSLTSWNGMVIGGTSILGGDGSKPTQASAVLFGWDTVRQAIQFEVVPVPGATRITDLITTDDGLVYGIADLTLFEFDPAAQKVTRSRKVPFSTLIYNSVGADELGRVWGLSGSGIFTLDRSTLEATIVGYPPAPISGGFAINGNVLYFTSGASLYSYALPAAAPTFSVNPGAYSAVQAVSILDSTPGATIYYTADGTTPTTSSTVYSGPLTISSSQTLEAIAVASGYSPSAPASAAYSIASPPPAFSLAATAVTVNSGAMAGNASTITVTPENGFAGSVTLSALITDSPQGACNLPTLSFGGTSPVSITGTYAGTGTLTISTTALTGSTLESTLGAGDRWLGGGGAILACLAVFGIPAKRKRWQSMLRMAALVAVLTSVTLACGGSAATVGPGNSGTTPGTYTITVTGTSGTLQRTAAISLTVN